MADAPGPERTPDGHFVVIDGRRWRATDPHIPDPLRQELVDELMSARRAVRAGEPDARGRVGDAKVALGERGHPWWDDHTDDTLRARAEATIRALLRKRDGKTICPSDVARVVGGSDWRQWMSDVRAVADALADDGRVVITQRGEPVEAGAAKGPVRIGRGERFDA
ncbi:hypothetical protein AFL01nite_06620 [Aeromicrobium flavum]|uniref:DUF3253 domain-containing protein n=1 Tax=Aeromicrobium flavum TaxID=416568 RepID=A0A512HSG7_9ACTN|nr:DUF3253 domain-containing protein [Aeromicrobium flavum]GEO88335.1 hypothetical protein AFL01nite_06620 [Aeromicrobium flavum]